MRFESALIQGRLVRRYKRFLADVALDDGAVVVAHCPNPGAMRTCMAPDARVWLSRQDAPHRKLAYTWELSEVDGALVCVNTGRANPVVAEALAGGVIHELCPHDEVRAEVRYGSRSRIDFLLTAGGRRCYLEVKNVTMRAGPGLGAFPDAVTARGTRHLEELMAMVAGGHRAAMLFCCSRSDIRAVRPADEIDPVYGQALRRAAAAGVELLAYRCDLSTRDIRLAERIPLLLDRRPVA